MIEWRAPQAADSEPIYLYDTPNNEVINLKGMFINQHGYKIRSIALSVQELDRISSTPVIGPKTNEEMANLFVASRIPWQRRLNKERVPDIEAWWKSARSISPNNSVLYFNDLALTDVEEDGVFHGSLNPAHWCFDFCPKCNWKPSDSYGNGYVSWYADCCANCGHVDRPAIVVDGQHRIRGMSSNPDVSNHHMQKVFSTWLCNRDNFNEKIVAKIFTEITSAAVPLKKLHKEFLMAKFKLAPQYDAHTVAGANRRRSYEIAADLNTSGTAWANVIPKGRVDMIEREQSIRCDVIDVHRLTNDYFFKWFNQGVFPSAMLNSDIIYSLENFLTAVINIYPSSYWPHNRSSLGALQHRGVFRLMLDVYEFTTLRLQNAGFAFPSSVTEYEKEINYIKDILWHSPNIRTYTQRDSDISVVRRILKCLYDNAPSPAISSSVKIPATINQWISQPPDPINIISQKASLLQDLIEIEFDSSFTHTHLSSISLGWPLNALSSASVYIERGGIVLGDLDLKTHHKVTIKISALTVVSGGQIIVGDKLDVKIIFKSLNGQTSNNNISLTVK
jgi:hypothetical protein